MSNSSKKRGLGRGISSLMDDYSFNGVFVEEVEGGKLLSLEINKVRPNPNQPRKKFDQETLDELAESIKTQGILQPLIVEKISGDEYAIIAGERRYRAALQLGMERVPAIVKEFSDLQRLEVSLIENIQRENLNPIEEAKAYLFLLDESELTQEELAERVGKKRSTISNSIRLLQLPKEMQESLLIGEFSAGHARALLSLVNPADREYLYRKLIDEELSVREAERLALELQQGKGRIKGKERGEAKERPIDLIVLEQRFLEACGTKVKIKGTLQKGKIEINYHSMDDLERIYDLLAQEESIEL